jgi:hypothetical protein
MVRIERSGVDMKPFVHQRTSRSVCSAFCVAVTLSVCGAADAAEYGLGNFAFDGKIEKLTVKLGPTQLAASEQKRVQEAIAKARD